MDSVGMYGGLENIISKTGPVLKAPMRSAINSVSLSEQLLAEAFFSDNSMANSFMSTPTIPNDGFSFRMAMETAPLPTPNSSMRGL